jgi:DNA-binding LacI/PurR family transcriptional regulator
VDRWVFVQTPEARPPPLQQTGRIGVITPFFTAPSFVQRLRGIASALSKENYELVIYTVDSATHLESYFASLPLTGNLDGLIIMSLPVSDANVSRLMMHNLQTVLIEYPHRELNSVVIDDVEGGRMAVEHLVKKGHRQIAFLGDTDLPEYAIHPVSLRLTGFRQAMDAAGLPVPEDFVRLAPYTQEQTRLTASKLLNLPKPPTAIFAATDFQALGVLKAARQLKFRVPEQLAVMGFDDLDMAEYADLTTIRQHLDESGRLAVELLVSTIKNPGRPVRYVNLPLQLIERLTT